MSLASVALSLTLCLDGGGTKTEMKILDERGALVAVIKEGVDSRGSPRPLFKYQF